MCDIDAIVFIVPSGHGVAILKPGIQDVIVFFTELVFAA